MNSHSISSKFHNFRAKSSSATYWKMEKSNHKKPRQFSALQALGQSTVKKSLIPTKNQDVDGRPLNTRARSWTFTRQFTIKSANNKKISKIIPVKV